MVNGKWQLILFTLFLLALLNKSEKLKIIHTFAKNMKLLCSHFHTEMADDKSGIFAMRGKNKCDLSIIIN